MQNKKPFTKKLETELAFFFESTPPTRLSRNLRRLLTSYLVLQQDGHLMDIEDLLVDLQNLFELLDLASDELVIASDSEATSRPSTPNPTRYLRNE